MKNNCLNLFALALLLTSVACSNPQTENLADTTQEEIASLDVTSRGNETSNTQEDMFFLLARKWVSETTSVFMELKIDGSFEGDFATESLIYGKWEVSDDQKVLKLKGSEGEEGKGKNFNKIYTVTEMTNDKLKLKDENGKELVFIASK